MTYVIYRGLAIILWFLKMIALVAVLIIALGFFSDKIDYANKYPVLKEINTLDYKMVEITRNYLPTKYEHKDISRYVTLGAVLFIFWFLRYWYEDFVFRANYSRATREASDLAKELQKKQLSEKSVKSLQDIGIQFTTALAGNKQDRRKLLKEFVKIKKKLESMGKDLAFLSIDVVDSTGMKEGESSHVVNHDFLEYHQFVEDRINANGCIKAAWTPDGLMACFAKLDDAIKAAQVILDDLEYFNRQVKNIRRDFAIRCGINAGYLFFDDASAMEEISDRVIDIAGHMQRRAQPNTIYIAKRVIKPVEVMKDFKEIDDHVDGLTACIWQPPMK